MAESVLRKAQSLPELQNLLAAHSNNVRGAAFELLVRHYLSSPFSTFGFETVWSTNKHVPLAVLLQLRLKQGDTKGIDLIARTRGGEYWAVQCKYHQDPDENLLQGECEGLVAGMHHSRSFKGGIVCTTAFDFSRNIEYPIERVAHEDFARLGSEFFEWLHAALKGKPPKPPKAFTPRDYQHEAIGAAVRMFASTDRAQFLMACATGKTLTAFFISEKLRARVVVWAVPNLTLAKQHLGKIAREYAARGLKADYMAVCSDKTVKASARSEENFDDPRVMGSYVGTDVESITAWLREKHRDADRLVIITTYQSSDILAKAARRAKLVPDLAIFDEAHRTVSHQHGAFAYLLKDKNLRIKRRAFFTATPRVYRGPNDAIRDMSDTAVYGPVAYRLTTRAAIERGIIADYVVHILGVSNASTRRYIQDREHLFIEELEDEANASTLAGTIGLLYLMRKERLNHALTFSSSLRRMEGFHRLVGQVDTRGMVCLTFSGNDSARMRKDRLELFEEARQAIASNVRVFVEGVDCPQIDCVALLDPKGSKVDIQQAVGRGLRPRGNKVAHIFVPVMLTEDGRIPDGAWTDPMLTLRALREQDDTLVDHFAPVVPGPQGPTGRVFVEAMPGINIKLREFRKQVSAKVWALRESWTDERLLADARKFKARGKWSFGSPSAYNAARDRGKEFFDRCCAHMERIHRERWTDSELFADAKKYKSKKEWSVESPSAENAARARGKSFFAKCCAHMEVMLHDAWTETDLLADAKKYKTRKEWRAESGGYSAAHKRGRNFFAKCIAHMKGNTTWSAEKLLADAKKYRTRTEWFRHSGGYQRARERGQKFVDKCIAHMKGNNTWTTKALLADAKKYKTKREWGKKGNGGGYAAARNEGRSSSTCAATT